MWRIAADTGGTFTDCHAIAPDGTSQRIKVLSTGCLRTRITEVISGQTFRLADHWGQAAGFLRGFKLRPLGNADCRTEFVIAHSIPDAAGCIVTVESALPEPAISPGLAE